MSLPLVFRAAAQVELEEAKAWYEGQRVGRGAELVTEVKLVFETITNKPKRYPIVSGNVREALVFRSHSPSTTA